VIPTKCILTTNLSNYKLISVNCKSFSRRQRVSTHSTTPLLFILIPLEVTGTSHLNDKLTCDIFLSVYISASMLEHERNHDQENTHTSGRVCETDTAHVSRGKFMIPRQNTAFDSEQNLSYYRLRNTEAEKMYTKSGLQDLVGGNGENSLWGREED